MERGNSGLRFLDRWLGIPLTVGGALFRRFDKKAKSSQSRIGIICLGAIGDLLLLSALVNGIKKYSPQNSVEIIASSSNSAIIPLIPGVDAHFAAPARNVSGLISYARGRGYDILFDSSQWARLGAIVSAFSGATLTVGFRTSGQYRSLAYDIAVNHDSSRHEVENFLALGRAVWPALNGQPGIKFSFPDNGCPGRRVYCHMWAAPGKGRRLKHWPSSYWAELINHLLGTGFEVYLTGAKNDSAACADFLREYFRGAKSVVSLAGKASLPELASFFRKAAAVVSVNTGIMHLAALAGAPTVGLHGATNPQRWGPVGERTVSLLPRAGESAYLNLGFEYPRNAKSAMPNLPVEDVLAALRYLGLHV